MIPKLTFLQNNRLSGHLKEEDWVLMVHKAGRGVGSPPFTNQTVGSKSSIKTGIICNDNSLPEALEEQKSMWYKPEGTTGRCFPVVS